MSGNCHNHSHSHVVELEPTEGSCSCCHGSGEEKQENFAWFIVRLVVAVAIVVVLMILKPTGALLYGGYIFAYLLAGYEVLLNAGKNLTKGLVFDENFLMAIASIAALSIGKMSEAVAVMAFYGVGELLQEMAVAKSRKNIASLMDIRPDFAVVKIDGKLVKINPEEAKIGDIIVIKPGEKVPLDGVIIEGESSLDTSMLTGESLPKDVGVKDELPSGAININGLLTVRVTKLFSESTATKILDLVEHANSKKAESEKFITKFARYYTPIVVCIAVLVAILPPLFGFGTYHSWIYKAIAFLVISCPCALVISIPISFFGGIGGAARNGILIKGGNYLEALYHAKTIVFDKTGTLTKGVLKVSKIVPAQGVSEEELIELAAIAEKHSTHPIGKAIVAYYGKDVDVTAQITEKAGQGIIAKSERGAIYAGNERLMREIGIMLPEEETSSTIVYVALDRKKMGAIMISDEPRDDVRTVLDNIRKLGIEKIIMLTGDNFKTAKNVANELGITDFKADLLPQDKVFELEKILDKETEGKTIFVGDGINDAPVIARADIGVAMGGIGSDAAVEAADIVLMRDDIGKIPMALKIARKTRDIVTQNIILALGIKLTIMVLALLSITHIWFAIFADVGVALLAVLNATRAMKVDKK